MCSKVKVFWESALNAKNDKRNNNNQRGFTLLEVLVALTICAVTAIMLYRQVNASVISSERLEEKSIALLIAKNHYNQLLIERYSLPVGEKVEQIDSAGREWSIRSMVSETTRPQLRQVTLVVYSDNDDEYPAITLTRLIGEN